MMIGRVPPSGSPSAPHGPSVAAGIMRHSVLAAAVVFGACSSSDPVTPNIPTNPLVSLLATQSATYALTQLGSQTVQPLLTWDALCDGLRWQNEYSDTIFFKGDGSYRRVYHYWNDVWRTIGVSRPQRMRTHIANELTGSISGEGDLLKLSVANKAGFTGFEIRGTALLRTERVSSDCQGTGTVVDAVFTRIAE